MVKAKQTEPEETQRLEDDRDDEIESSSLVARATTVDRNSSDEEVTFEEVKVNEVKEDDVPDGGYGWFIVFGSFIVHLIIGGMERGSGVFYLKFLSKFEQSAAATAWCISLSSGIRLMFGPVASFLCHKYSCRAVVLIGGILSGISMMLSAPVNNLYLLFVTYGIIGGFGRCFAYAPAVMMVGLYFNERRGLAVGVATSGVGFGSFGIPTLTDVLFEYYGFWGAFMVLGAFIMNLSVCGAMFRPLWLHWKISGKIVRREREKEIKDEVEKSMPVLLEEEISSTLDIRKASKLSNFKNMIRRMSSSKALTENGRNLSMSAQKNTNPSLHTDRKVSVSNQRRASTRSEIKQHFLCCYDKSPDIKHKQKRTLFEFSLLKDLRFCCFCAAILLFTVAFQAAYVFIPAYATSNGIEERKATYLIAITGFFDGCGRIVSGTVLDLEKVRPYRIFIYNFNMFIVGAVSFVVPYLHTFNSLAVCCAIYGLLVGTYISQKSVIIVDILGVKKLVNSFGILIFFQGIGIFVGPPIAGAMKDVSGNYDGGFYFGGGVMIFGALILTFSNILHYIHHRKDSLTNNTTLNS